MFCTQAHFVLEDKEIAVKIRSNSHYRNSGFNRSSRNACQSVTHKSLLGSSGRCVSEFGAFVPMRYGRMPFDSQYPWRVLLFYPFAEKERMIIMKKVLNSTVSLILSAFLIFCLAACSDNGTVGKDGLWANAVYSENAELGKGEKTLTVEVEVEDKTVIFTVHTDKETVGEALQENGLIDGEEGEYGLYVKTVNGIVADYDVDQSYWAFLINGEYASTGVDGASITEGETYRLVYTK